MPEDTSRNTTPNRLLSRLARADFGLLEPHLEAVDLPVRKTLEPRNRRVDRVYFIESGIASVVANGARDIEVGVIGREGMTGLSVVMCNDDRAPHDTYMQVSGKGLCMASDDLRNAIAASVGLHHALLRYAFAFMVQATQTAAANGRGKIEERLSRWLLMAHDRTDGDEFSLTHEFLATMLGVRRPGVTVALQQLERVGLITHRRGVIAILDRKALEERSNGAYFPTNDDRAARPTMEPRKLLDNGSYGPCQLKVLFKAFDDAWDGIAANFDSPLAIQAARLRLANIILGMARNGINNPEQIKSTALQIMAQ